MYSTLISVALFSALAIQGALADFTVETPTITQCEPVKLQWDSTNAKSYNVAIVSASNPCDDIIADLGDHTVNHITWTPTLKAGDKVMLSILDTDDNEGWSGEITVKDGDASCLASSSSSVSSSAAHSSSSVEASSAAASGTTLVVNPAAAPSTAPAAPSSSGASVVGAAGSGVLGSDNGALSVRFSSPSIALGAFVAIAALAF